MSAPAVDPITLEVLRETFSSIVREMRGRAYSTASPPSSTSTASLVWLPLR